MGATALQTRCTVQCVGASHAACASESGFDSWVAEELHQAISAQDLPKIRELVSLSPAIKERELAFPGEQGKVTALALALNRRDVKIVRELLDAGVSPNLAISEQQRSLYAQRSQLAALNGADPDIQNLTPNTHFEALCCVQHKDLFTLLLEKGANPNSGIIQVCHCGDVDMLDALLARGAEPNICRHGSTPMLTSVKSKLQPYEKALMLLRQSADPNFVGNAHQDKSRTIYPALTLATRKRDHRMVRILLEATADVNRTVGGEGLPNVMFWAAYWGELELIKLFVTHSKHTLDLTIRKYTNETIFDVASTSRTFAAAKKPRHIAKLPLPSRPAAVYESILQVLENYRAQHPHDTLGNAPVTGSTTAATRFGSGDGASQDAISPPSSVGACPAAGNADPVATRARAETNT